MRDFGFHHIARLHRREIIVRRPARRVPLAVAGDRAGLEGLEHHTAIAEVVEAHLVEIVQAAVEVQPRAPPVGALGVDDEAARLKGLDAIGAGPDGCLKGRFGEILALPLRLFQDRAQAQDQRQFAVLGVEGEAHRPLARGFGCRNRSIGGGKSRRALGAQRLEGPQHVLHRHGAAVRESGLGAQGKFHEGPRGIRLDRFGQKTVKRKGLVIRPAQQRLDRQGRYPLGRAALHDVGVQRIEPARDAKDDPPALGRIGVGIGQRHKIRGQGGVAIHSYAMLRLGQRRGGGKEGQCRDDPSCTCCEGSGLLFHGGNVSCWLPFRMP